MVVKGTRSGQYSNTPADDLIVNLFAGASSTRPIIRDSIPNSSAIAITFQLLRADIYLHAVAHVEYFVHFAPRCPAFFLYQIKQRRNREHVVFDYMLVFHEVEHLGPGASCAVDHAVDFRTHLAEKLLDYGCICASGGKAPVRLQSGECHQQDL